MLWELSAFDILSLVVTFILVPALWWLARPRCASPGIFSPKVGLAGLAVFVASYGLSLRLSDSIYHVAVNVSPTELFNMALTLSAAAWLFYRSWQTLWKPIPELVSILGVDIPQAPDVCLSGIDAGRATLNWSKPPSNRPVDKFVIQVNGVDVGHSPGNETAIVVTGLRPNHFYNIHVVAVGPNNFRTSSPLLRFRTLGVDGKPELGNSRLPPSLTRLSHPHGTSAESIPTVETAPVLESNAIAHRDAAILAPVQRRNTLNRRHSPTVAASDQQHARLSDSEASLGMLNDKFEAIRKEIDDTATQFAKDEAEFRQQEEGLRKEINRRRSLLRKKEDQTAELKNMMHATKEQMRAAEKERAKKEQQLKDKETKRAKIWENIAKCENEVKRMKRERQSFEAHKAELVKERDYEIHKLDKENAELQESCLRLEADLRDKGKQLQDLKATRELLPGADSDKWREEGLKLKRDWDMRRRDLHNRLVEETKEGNLLNLRIRELYDQLKLRLQHGGRSYYNQPGSSSVDFDLPASIPPPRLGHNGCSLVQVNGLPSDRQTQIESNSQRAMAFNNASFAHGPFMDPTTNGINELLEGMDFKAVAGPLSPSAQTLLPSNIFEESEETDALGSRSPFLPEPRSANEEGPQSPASSSMSLNAFSSPQGSVNSVLFPKYTEPGDGKPMNAHSSPSAVPTAGHRIATFLSTFQRNRGAKPPDAGSPPLGNLKPAESQSFPSITDENESMTGKRRSKFSSLVGRASLAADFDPSGASVTASRPLSLRFNPLKGAPVDREPEISRPASIASTDLLRPSTDSGSIWGAPGKTMTSHKNRVWSPGDGRWTSRNGSRRASLQSSNVLTTTLASADDEILGEDDLLNPETCPSQLGVIGSRPPGAPKLISQRLNPAAPTFMGHIFRKDRGKERPKDRTKEDKNQGREMATPTLDPTPSWDELLSADTRAWRDTLSVHTQTSVSESHESLQLDGTISNAHSNVKSPSSPSLKEPEKAVMKIFRKGSSSKFSLSSRLGKESGLFKKGPGSAGNSERSIPAEQGLNIGDVDDVGDDIAVLGRSYDSVASSPSIGPSKSRDGKDGGRMGSWRFSMSSMKKDKETPGKEKSGTEKDRAVDEGQPVLG